ncbi:MAG TPA: hypothetical protein PLV50_07125 [Smithella sp.]|nr:hypothetical protein [Smithella sp.]MDM7987391.1 hypothetical protein [Smithella sp.]HNY50570.1 hypothetical protein [Smithella sp.]HOG90292.1 hypothetical protein [Smithella sp.]HOU51946.1 hypothetical protein [Smithella sp.]
MKKLVYKMLLLSLVVLMPASAMAGVSVHFNIPLPPPLIFPAPPELVVIPETDVYAVPNLQEEIFFYGGWWWRPWDGRWYRSRYHDRGWTYYPHTPYFHKSIPPQWRNDYRDRHWKGYRWEPRPIPQRELQRNWEGWKRDRRWEKQNWGVQGWHKRHTQPYRDDRQKVRPRTDYRPVPQQGENHYVPGVGPVPGPAHHR